MSHTQFLDESEFSLKIGGIEINPTTGDGIEGLLKLDDWTIEKRNNDLVFFYDSVEKFRLSNVNGASSIAANYNEFVYTASNNQTTFSGADNFGETLSYSVEKAVVFMNGVRLSANVDFTATDGSSVVFTESVSNNDIVAIQSF